MLRLCKPERPVNGIFLFEQPDPTNKVESFGIDWNVELFMRVVIVE